MPRRHPQRSSSPQAGSQSWAGLQAELAWRWQAFVENDPGKQDQQDSKDHQRAENRAQRRRER